MKQLFYTFITLFVFASCTTTKIDYLSRSNEDRTLFDVVKALNKRPDDSAARNALPVLYPLAQQRHLAKITSYNTDNNISRWDKVIEEYSILQKMYDAISIDQTANFLVTPVNYQTDITQTKQLAADNYYSEANTFLEAPGRDNAKNAWSYFKKADKLVPGYKDSKAKMLLAYENAIINVVIYPIQDNSFFFNTSWGNSGFNYSNEYFQRNLVQELGGTSARRYPAKFYTDWEARRENIKPDWVVDLTLRNLDIPTPSGSTYSRSSSQQIETGRDSSGKVIYETVYARVNITRQSFTARGQIDVEITEAGTRRNISSRSYNEDYRWQEEYADYTGDSRALSGSDLQLVNNNHRFGNEPNKDEVLSELYRRFYPQVKSNIMYTVDW